MIMIVFWNHMYFFIGPKKIWSITLMNHEWWSDAPSLRTTAGTSQIREHRTRGLCHCQGPGELGSVGKLKTTMQRGLLLIISWYPAISRCCKSWLSLSLSRDRNIYMCIYVYTHMYTYIYIWYNETDSADFEGVWVLFSFPPGTTFPSDWGWGSAPTIPSVGIVALWLLHRLQPSATRGPILRWIGWITLWYHDIRHIQGIFVQRLMDYA